MGLREFKGNGTPADRHIFTFDGDFSATDALLLPERRSDLNEHPFYLSIFHFNDLHCSILDFVTCCTGTPVFSKIAAAAEDERTAVEGSRNEGVLFLSAGDDSTGSPLDDLAGYDGKDFISHAAYSALSIAGLDATVLGNHDLDAGLGTLRNSIQQDAAFPVLSANLVHQGELDGLVFPAAIIVIKGVRVGIIGVTTPGQMRSREGSMFSIEPPLKPVQDLYTRLFPLCDSVLILSHLGYRLGSSFASVKIMGDVELAAELREEQVDLIVGGHTHDLLNIHGLESGNVVNGIPILQAGYNGLFYGKAVLRVSNTNCLVHASLSPSAYGRNSDAFDNAFENSRSGMSLSILRESLGPQNLPSFYRRRDCEILKDCHENPMANYITQALSCQLRSNGIKHDFFLIDGASMVRFFHEEKATVNIIDVYRLMPYADTIVLLELDGRKVGKMIQNNVLRLNPNNAPHVEKGFLHFSREIRYKILGKSRQAVDITINGVPLESCYNFVFTLAMPNFTQGLSRSWEECESQGDESFFSLRKQSRKDTGLYARKLFVEFIRKNGVSGESGFLLDRRLEIVGE